MYNLKSSNRHSYRESGLKSNNKNMKSIKITEGCEAKNKSGEGVIITIKQSEIHKDYLFFLYNFFLIRGYTSNLEPRLYKITIKGLDKLYFGYEFNTYTFRSLVWLYELFYKNGKSQKEILTAYIYGPRGLLGFIRNGEYYTVMIDHSGSIRLIIKNI